MKMNENVRKEFSLDYYQTLLETYGRKEATAYRDIFVLQRKINRLQKKYWIADGATFDVEVYNKWLKERWIVYASEYKDYFVSKNLLIKTMDIIRFKTEEQIDTKVEEFEPDRDDDEPDEMPDIETKKRKAETEQKNTDTELEQARAKYEEKFWKKVNNFKKNDLERILNKLAE